MGKAILQMEQVTQQAPAAEELSAQSESLRAIVSRLTALAGTDASTEEQYQC